VTRATDQPHEAAFHALLDAAGIRYVRAADGELVAPGRRGYVSAHDGRLRTPDMARPVAARF
jgi:hypothetical protein